MREQLLAEYIRRRLLSDPVLQPSGVRVSSVKSDESLSSLEVVLSAPGNVGGPDQTGSFSVVVSKRPQEA